MTWAMGQKASLSSSQMTLDKVKQLMLEGRAAIPPQPGGMSKQEPQETQQKQIRSPSPVMD